MTLVLFFFSWYLFTFCFKQKILFFLFLGSFENELNVVKFNTEMIKNLNFHQLLYYSSNEGFFVLKNTKIWTYNFSNQTFFVWTYMQVPIHNIQHRSNTVCESFIVRFFFVFNKQHDDEHQSWLRQSLNSRVVPTI